jgi:hypothetical protein
VSRMNYTELDWRWVILLGAALRDGLLGPLADGARKADGLAADLGLDPRAVFIVLSALSELRILDEGERETSG